MTKLSLFLIAWTSFAPCSSSSFLFACNGSKRTRSRMFYTEADPEAMKREIEEMRSEALRRILALSEKAKTVEESGGDFWDGAGTKTKEKGMETATSEAFFGDDSELLEDTHWKVALNIGREPGTWMPKTWGVSGDRLILNLELKFTSEQVYDREEFLGGVAGAKICRVVDHRCVLGPSKTEGSRVYRVKDGGYRICKGDGPLGTHLLRFYFELEERAGHTGSDVYCPQGRVYCTCGYFPQNVDAGKAKKYHLRQRLQDLERSYSDIQYQVENPENKLGFWKLLQLQRKLFQINLEIQNVQKQLSQTRVTEPDTSLLRFSRRRDVALTKEGGVCCKVIKEAGRREFHILGKFGIGAVQPREGHESL